MSDGDAWRGGDRQGGGGGDGRSGWANGQKIFFACGGLRPRLILACLGRSRGATAPVAAAQVMDSTRQRHAGSGGRVRQQVRDTSSGLWIRSVSMGRSEVAVRESSHTARVRD